MVWGNRSQMYDTSFDGDPTGKLWILHFILILTKQLFELSIKSLHPPLNCLLFFFQPLFILCEYKVNKLSWQQASRPGRTRHNKPASKMNQGIGFDLSHKRFVISNFPHLAVIDVTTSLVVHVWSQQWLILSDELIVLVKRSRKGIILFFVKGLFYWADCESWAGPGHMFLIRVSEPNIIWTINRVEFLIRFPCLGLLINPDTQYIHMTFQSFIEEDFTSLKGSTNSDTVMVTVPLVLEQNGKVLANDFKFLVDYFVYLLFTLW